MPALRPKKEDKFSRVRASKNAPERQEAVAKMRTPRGPSSVRPASKKARAPVDTNQKIRDEERVFNLVHSILSAWKADKGQANNTAHCSGIIKVSRRKVEGALRDLKNTRFTKIPSLINDVLVYNEVCHEFGQWVYVEHDSPDWIFVLLPDNSEEVTRANIVVSKDTGVAVVTTSNEPLLEDSEDDEDEIPENVEYHDTEVGEVEEEDDEE